MNPVASALIALLLAALLLPAASCGPRMAASDPEALRRAAAQPAVRDEDDGRAGIELRRWMVECPPEAFDAALAEFAGGSGEAAAEAELHQGGLRFTVGRESDLPMLLERLGGSRTDLRVWHGQATEWRELSSIAIPRPEVLEVDGHRQPIPSGRLSLEFRGWSLPMEDGANCEIEVAARWRGESRPAFREAGTIDREGRWLDGLSFRRPLARGEVLLLTASIPPRPDETGEGDADGETAPPRERPPSEGPASPGRRLLTTPSEALQVVLLLWPHLPEWMFPPPADSPGDAAMP